MDTLPEDKQVVELISKLKYSSGAYPRDMLSSRRQQFIRQITSAGLGIGITAGIKEAAKQSQGAGTAVTTVTGKIIETVLIAAIVIEAGATAYVYRHKIADFFKNLTGSPDTTEIIQPPINNSSSEIVILPTLTPPPTSSTPSTVSPFYTPAPGTQQINNNTPGSGGSGGSTTNVSATPVPTDNNGNQFGLTPKPVRTNDNTDNNGNNGNNN